VSDHGKTTSCDRCGRRVTVNSARKRPITVCADCRYSDREWLRLVTTNTNRKEHAA
jgi:hypothetical protein